MTDVSALPVHHSGRAAATVAGRVAALDWPRIGEQLDAHGSAVARTVLAPEECERLTALYPAEAPFRSRIVMGWHGFGRGEYRYFAYPLPELVSELRTGL